MLGARTKQVFSYGRRGSRIVNVSDRRESANNDSSDASSDVATPARPRPLKRENAVIISPAKHRVGLRRTKCPSRSPRNSPLATAQTRRVHAKATRDAATKRKPSNLESSTHIRQPLTPLSLNGTPSSEQPFSLVKGKSKAKPGTRTSLKPHSPVIAVDILVFDEDGSMVTQERRLSHTDVQANPVRTATGKSKIIPKNPPPSPPPIHISDDSDLEEAVFSPKPAARRSKRRPHTIVISSDDSEADDKCTVSKSHSRSTSLRVEVVIPPAPFRTSKVVKTPPPSPPSLPLLAPPIPIPKLRQLTPIRGSSSRSIFRHAQPTPSPPTEADLSLELAQLDLSDVTEADDLIFAQPVYLVPLLNECAQTSPYEFSAFIETFPFDPIVQSWAEDEDARFRKIGEASYSEVFGIGDVVLKVIPIRREEETTTAEIPPPSDAKDVLKEIIVTREIGEICGKFVKLLKTYVVRGRYPSLLLDLWDEYNESKGSESIRPDSFGLAQVYVIIILPNGGPDLESFTFKNVSKSGWHQACGIFWQVARALKQAEELANFEHRDLHWGQILVKSIPVKRSASKCSTPRASMDDTRFGVKVTIIDLGLSRMHATDARGSKTYWTPFDDEIFEGEGDYQYDIYRMMRDLIGGVWKCYQPLTNVMWLHYLATKLLHEKRLKHPGSRKQTGGETRVVSPTGYDEQECYDCLVEMERLLGNCIRKGQSRRRKTVAPSTGPRSARDVFAYGTRRGWV